MKNRHQLKASSRMLCSIEHNAEEEGEDMDENLKFKLASWGKAMAWIPERVDDDT